jgi:hypothetical protein
MIAPLEWRAPSDDVRLFVLPIERQRRLAKGEAVEMAGDRTLEGVERLPE